MIGPDLPDRSFQVEHPGQTDMQAGIRKSQASQGTTQEGRINPEFVKASVSSSLKVGKLRNIHIGRHKGVPKEGQIPRLQPAQIKETLLIVNEQLQSAKGLRAMIGGIKHAQMLGEGHFKKAYLLDQNVISTINRKNPAFAQEVNNFRMILDAGVEGVVQPKGLIIGEVTKGEETAYLVTEFCDGGTFESRIPVLTNEEKLQRNVEIARGMAKLHTAGIVHHDLKADNVLISRGQALINDFGLISDRSTPFVRGTHIATKITPPDFLRAIINKDQEGLKAWNDPSYDVFQFGLMLYATFLGKGDLESIPWTNNQYRNMAISNKPLSEDLMFGLLNSDLPEALQELILDSIHINPQQRPSMEDVANRLESIIWPENTELSEDITEPSHRSIPSPETSYELSAADHHTYEQAPPEATIYEQAEQEGTIYEQAGQEGIVYEEISEETIYEES